MNKLAQAFSSGRLVLTAACLPPRGSDAEAITALASILPPQLDAVVVADNPDRIRGSALSSAILLGKRIRASVILSMTTRDRNRIALMSDALGAAALNISGILCVTGNHQSMSVCPQASAANDLDSVQFAQAMKKIVLYGSGMNGKELGPRLTLQIGTAAHPYMRPMELNLIRLKKKIVVGADFVMTQAVFDLNSFSEWMESVRAAGLDKRTAVIPSVLLFDSLEKVKELQRCQTYGPIGDAVVERIARASDPAAESVAMAADVAERLKEVPGIRGINILCGGCESLAGDLIRQAGLGGEQNQVSPIRSMEAATTVICSSTEEN